MNFLKNSIVKINLGTLLIIVLVFVLGWQLGHRDYLMSWQSDKPKNEVDFKLFWQTWNLLTLKYIDNKSINPQKLYYGAIAGMVAAVGDPYTVFLPPEAQKSTKEQLGGAFEGVGIQLGYNKDKRLVVIAPLKGTPADKAGVKAGDLIVEINSKDTTNLSLPEAVSLIRGQKGTAVKLALFRENETKPRDVTLTRDTIVVKTVEYTSKTTKSGKNIAYLRVSSFGEKTKDEWDIAVKEAMSNNTKGVIVDVRNNPGGYLEASVYLASEFLDGGKVVLQEDGQGVKQDLSVMRQGQMLDLPLVILINKGSASASEILAGAIQDRKRGTLIGDQSFGKGTIQSAEDLPENTGIHITTAKWLTPNGRWIHGIGLTPDIKVEIPADLKDPLADPQLEKALETLDK
ncbi:MAG: S41 family peptidase [Candidatus Daviesbacteria bacterium]|nr:S41 family peptidase [Candidatus Daviesbacteria bacterium]